MMEDLELENIKALGLHIEKCVDEVIGFRPSDPRYLPYH